MKLLDASPYSPGKVGLVFDQLKTRNMTERNSKKLDIISLIWYLLYGIDDTFCAILHEKSGNLVQNLRSELTFMYLFGIHHI